jgi:penicillin-binding protein 1B
MGRAHVSRSQKIIGALLALILAWLAYLNFTITQKFDGHRWDLPAQVYARPLELYAGLSLPPERLARELQRLGYRRTAQQPSWPGSFRATRRSVELLTREFRFWDELQPVTALNIEFDDDRVTRLTDGLGNGDIPIMRLDPLLVGSIFPTHGEDRLIVTPTQTSTLFEAALKAVEDRRFDTHHGVDPQALLRAIWVNLQSGEVAQGGSTITQQLVKNYFLDNRRTLWRKLREAVMAVILEWHYDKADLLNAYINEVYMGQDGGRAIHGFGLASRYYFSRPLAELDVHELALLVALVKGPTYYDPWRHPQRALERRNLVLQLMADSELITPEQARKARNRELDVWDRDTAGASYYPAYLQLVRAQLAEQYRDKDLTTAGLRVFTALDPLVQATAEARLAAGLTALDRRNNADDSNNSDNLALAGAVVITSVQSGEALAIVGDRRAGYAGFNRALDARRPVGSLIKPVVYLAALQSGRYTMASLIDDEEISVTLDNGDSWAPQNYNGESHGPVTLLRALVESFNLATVRLGMDIGVTRVAETLTALGGPDDVEPYPSLLLGAAELTPLEVAQVYGTLANAGFRTPLRAVRSVVNSNGNPLERYPMALEQAADAVAIYQLGQALVEVMRRGTGRGARSVLPAELVAAGKTGTSGDYRDSWFAGFTGEHVMVVWVGYDDNRPTGLTGASGALKIWSSIMQQMNSTAYEPPLPTGLRNRWIDFDTGQMARPGCADVVELALPRDVKLESKPGCGPGLGLLRWLDEVFD